MESAWRGGLESGRKPFRGHTKQISASQEETMNSRADICGQWDDRTARNTLPDESGSLDRDYGTGGEREGVPLHRGRALAQANNGGVPGANSKTGKLGVSVAATPGNLSGSGTATSQAAADLARIPEGVRATVLSKPGEYDARRLRSQREIIRDVMISAADCETWLTLGELRALTRYGEASISAQLRHLRKTENGGYDVIKRHREGVTPERPGTDGRGECVWEYRITRGMCGIETGRASSGGLNAVA
jgi:hypothetical protein